MMYAINIEYDTDGELIDDLPDRVLIPAGMTEFVLIPAGMTEFDDISDYITEITGFCHYGFDLETL